MLYRAIQREQIAVIPMDLTDVIGSFSLVNVYLDSLTNFVYNILNMHILIGDIKNGSGNYISRKYKSRGESFAQ